MITSKIKLPQVTLICLTNKNFALHKEAIDKSCEGIEFGAVKLIWDEKCDSIEEWNRKIIFDLPKYVDTTHALLIHADSAIVHPELWDPEWLALDYIGAPWPLPRWKGEFEDTKGRIQRVGNSVSLRSKKLMELVAKRPMEYHYGNNNEDGQICVWERVWLEEQGCKFATLDQAIHFSKEHEIPENKNIKSFMFHSL